MGIFSHAQGQLTLQSVVGSGQISNSSELSCMYEKDRIRNSREKVATQFFAIITLHVAMETSSRIWLGLPRLQKIENFYTTCHTRHASVYTHPYGTLLQIYRKMINKSIKHIKVPVSRISVLLKRHIPRMAFNQYGL